MTDRATATLQEVDVPARPAAAMRQLLIPGAAEQFDQAVAKLASLPRVWNINTTARGGGVAELLESLVGYARGVGADVRWLVLGADAEFFRITKRLHNLLHDHPGDGGRLGAAERAVYEHTLAEAAKVLPDFVAEGDAVVLHDPQTAGLAAPLRELGADVIWRCHVGTPRHTPLVEEAWAFLMPYVAAAQLHAFSSPAFVPPELSDGSEVRTAIIHPSIDPLSAKNQPLRRRDIHGILTHVGLVKDGSGSSREFRRGDGSRGLVEYGCDVLRTGPSPRFAEPLVVQVSRWDRLKDPIGVLRCFCEHVLDRVPAQLILAGPSVGSVADDPEAAEVLTETEAFWRTLPHAERRHVQLACLPMKDRDENAAIVNALQRQAAVIVQKSIAEGFGLTVTEAMWKEKPVVAAAVGGIPEQIDDLRDGRLVDPTDLPAFGGAIADLLEDPEAGATLGRAAHERVTAHFLPDRHLLQFDALIRQLAEEREAARA